MTRRPSSRDLLDLYVRHLNRLLNSTVSQSRLSILLRGNNQQRGFITRFQQGAMRPLQLGERIWLLVEQVVEADAAAGTVEVLSYRYVYTLGSDPWAEDAWIFRYEYDRSPGPGYPYSAAHVHLNLHEGGRQVGSKVFKKLHLPTGRVGLEQILIHLILEFDVPTIGDAAAALELLRASHAGLAKPPVDV